MKEEILTQAEPDLEDLLVAGDDVPIYDVGDFVFMDRDRHIKGIITGITIRGMKAYRMFSYEVNWFSNGCKNSDWFEQWRIEPWEE